MSTSKAKLFIYPHKMCNIDICPQCRYILPFEEGRVFNSPLDDLLGKNQPPTAAQRRTAEEVIAEISLSIRILEEQMSRLRKSTETLTLYKREHELLLSKFLDFPPETLGLIFQAYVGLCATGKEIVTTDDLEFQPGDVLAMPRSISRMNALLTITTVCRQWRMIALSMSSLWSNIHLSLGFRNLEKWEKIAVRFIRRAGQHRLNIDVDLEDWGNADKGRTILRVLGSKSELWKEARFMLSLHTVNYLNTRLAKLDNRLPELQFLSLGMSSTDMAPVLRFTTAPKLCALQLINLRPHRLVLPFHQLHELFLVHMHWRSALNLLNMCPNLTFLRCEILDSRVDSIHAYRTIIVKHLQLSSLEAITNSHGSLFLKTLELPALSSLSLTISSTPVPDETYRIFQYPTLLQFLSRSQCTLQSLSLNNVQLCASDCVEHASLFSSITTLKLAESSDIFYDDIFNLLTITAPNGHPWMMDSNEPVFPLLRHLEYTYTGTTNIWGPSYYEAVFESVNHVIAARWSSVDEGDAVKRLQSVKVKGLRPDTDLHRIMAYRKLLEFHCKELSVETYFSTSCESPNPDPISRPKIPHNRRRFWSPNTAGVTVAHQTALT